MINDKAFARHLERARAIERSQYVKLTTSIYLCVVNVLDSICRDDPSLASETKEHMKELCEMILKNQFHVDAQIDLREHFREAALRCSTLWRERELAKAAAPAQSV